MVLSSQFLIHLCPFVPPPIIMSSRSSVQFSRSVMSNSLQPHEPHACLASLPITNCQSPCKRVSIESVMPSNHLILCRPLLILPSIFPSIRVFSNESALPIRWPKYCIRSSVQFSHSVVSDSLRPHESQHARPPCPSQTPGIYANSRPSSQ